MKQEVIVEGMKCDGCAENVNRLFSALDGVERVLIDREAKEVAVESNREISETEFSEALATTKYTVVEVK